MGKSNDNRLSDSARNKGRMAIYAIAGLYILYMAYKIFDSLPTSSGNEKILMIVFMILFVIIGGGMVVMGLYKGYQMSKETSEAMRRIQEQSVEKDEAGEDMPETQGKDPE